jgi:hypothetical protein
LLSDLRQPARSKQRTSRSILYKTRDASCDAPSDAQTEQ